MKQKHRDRVLWVLMVFLLIVVVAITAIRIRHPKFTETQILIKLVNWTYEGE